MLSVQDPTAVLLSLLAQLDDARARTDDVFEIVNPDFLYDRPIPERHRIVFYVGHLEAFDWNLLKELVRAPRSAEPELDKLFAFGIDPVDGSLPSDTPADWPSLETTRRYSVRSRETLDASIAARAAAMNERESAAFAQRLHVAIEHRLMHEETLAYMFHQLPLEAKVRRSSPAPPPVAELARNVMVEVPAGSATLGLSRDAHAFGWDNEFEQHSVFVPAFHIDAHMVTNGQFLEFVSAGGYDHRALWSEDDWNWKTEAAIRHPVFWKRVRGGWWYRSMFDEFPLPSDWPVYLSHAEASAYARWAGKALPTEAQWHRAAYGAPDDAERPYPWGPAPASPQYGNFDFQGWDPVPVAAFPDNRSAFGVSGLLGNGWEWTSTLFRPFDGFQAFSFYPGYSANFFDGKHYVIKGGSARTASCMLRRSFRNWFQPNYQYAYAGFRCVRA